MSSTLQVRSYSPDPYQQYTGAVKDAASRNLVPNLTIRQRITKLQTLISQETNRDRRHNLQNTVLGLVGQLHQRDMRKTCTTNTDCINTISNWLRSTNDPEDVAYLMPTLLDLRIQQIKAYETPENTAIIQEDIVRVKVAAYECLQKCGPRRLEEFCAKQISDLTAPANATYACDF